MNKDVELIKTAEPEIMPTRKTTPKNKKNVP